MHDPLINWRLMTDGQNEGEYALSGSGAVGQGKPDGDANGGTSAGAGTTGGPGSNTAGAGKAGTSSGAAGGGGGLDNPLQRASEHAVHGMNEMPVGSVNAVGAGSLMVRGSLLGGTAAGANNVKEVGSFRHTAISITCLRGAHARAVLVAR